MELMKKYEVIEDPKYGFLRLDPIPSQEEVEKFYAEEFYSLYNSYFNDSSLQIQKEEKDFFDARWEDIYQNCEKQFGKENIRNKGVFDIGFGFAQALIYLKEKGLRVAGVEPSKEGVEYAKSQGVEAYQGGIEEFSFVADRRFDIVLLMNVLEHLRKPAETLINIRQQLLNNTGLLVIDVPNEFNDLQTVANIEYDLNEWWVVPPNHINYFSASSLKLLLEKCGYKVVHSEASFPLEIFLLFGDVYVGDQKLGKVCHNKRVNFERLMRKYGKHETLSKFYQSLADLNLGRQVVIYAVPDADQGE